MEGTFKFKSRLILDDKFILNELLLSSLVDLLGCLTTEATLISLSLKGMRFFRTGTRSTKTLLIGIPNVVFFWDFPNTEALLMVFVVDLISEL